MATEKMTINAFIKSWSKDEVICYIVEEEAIRKFTDHKNLFDGFKLFIGKQVIFETEVRPGTMTIKCLEVKTYKIKQLFKFYLWKLKQFIK